MTSSKKLGGMPRITLTSEILNELARITTLRMPSEACGVLLPTPRSARLGSASQVVELPNRSMDAGHAYAINGEDVQLEIEDWAKTASEAHRDGIALWHSHPSGFIGPSQGDLEDRLEGIAYLVVCFNEHNQFIPSWF